MAVCCCALAGTAACQHCRNNPFATDVWSNTITTDRIEARPFGNGIDVCPVCGKPSTIGKPQTNYDRIVSMKPEALAIAICTDFGGIPWCKNIPECQDSLCVGCVVKWLKQEAE